MQENYTYDALVHFLYHDMPAEEAAETVQQLEENAVLRAVFDELVVAKNLLPKARFNPSPAVLNTILQYSTKTALEAQI